MDIKKVSKALAGAIATILVATLLKFGIVIGPEVDSAIVVLLDFLFAGLLGFVAVWLAPKNKA